MIKTIFFSFFLLVSLHAESILNRLDSLQIGDRLVLELPQSICVIGVTKTSPIHLRVASATKDVLVRQEKESWITWFEEGADDAIRVDSMIIEGKNISSSIEQTSWLRTLLNLELTPLPKVYRKRAGPRPHTGEHDLRPIWQPKIIVDRQSISSTSDAFTAIWPDDSSPLANRPLILYFPLSDKAVQALPYWIESPTSSYHVTVIDSSHPCTP